MSALGKKLKNASFRYEDVDICLNGELANRRDALYDELEAAAAGPADVRLGQKLATTEVQERIDALESEMRDEIVTLRFRTLTFEKWNLIIAKYPPRDGVVLDARKGYDVVAVTKRAAEASGWSVDDGKTETITEDEWKELWENLSGGDFDRIWGVITRLNESNGWAGVDFLKKGSEKTSNSTETSSSPEPSE